MRVTLMHNPTAGTGGHDAGRLWRALRRAGYEVTYRSTKGRRFERAFEDPGELVVVAGGDGTVAKVARRLAGRGIPLAIIPLGTANNIASALAIVGTPDTLIAGWASARLQLLDVGVAEGAWGTSRFIEGVGIGAFTHAMCLVDAKAEDHPTDRQERGGFARELRLLRRMAAGLPAQECRLSLDGVEIEERFVLCEAMNVRSIGPRLPLAPHADPGDGLLDVVLVTESDRGRLSAYLTARLAGDDAPPVLTVHRAARVRMAAPGASVRVDDTIERAGPSGAVELRLEPRALPVLVPA